MRSAEYNAFWQEHQAAAKNFYASVRALVALIDHSIPDSDLNLARRRIRANLRTCQAARDALEHHQEEHRCSGWPLSRFHPTWRDARRPFAGAAWWAFDV